MEHSTHTEIHTNQQAQRRTEIQPTPVYWSTHGQKKGEESEEEKGSGVIKTRYTLIA